MEQDGVELVKGGTYSFRVPSGDRWKDGRIEITADGYRRWYLSPFTGLLRAPRADWFKLIGAIGKLGTERVIIGSYLDAFTSPATGELFCFANDVRFMYWNNSGVIKLTIRRLA